MDQWVKDGNVVINNTWWCLDVASNVSLVPNDTLASLVQPPHQEISIDALQELLKFLVPCKLENATGTQSEVPEESEWATAIVDGVWTVLFSLMITMAIAGNAIVLWIVTAHRRMWSVTNSFIVNLSVADLLNTVFNTIFSFITMKSRNWLFGRTFCTANHFFAYSTVCASSFTLSAISCDRHISILRPSKPHMRGKTAAFILVFVWLASIIIAVPPTLYSVYHTSEENGEKKSLCLLIWPDGPPTISFYDYAFNIVFTVTTYGIPMLQMLISYSHIGAVLWSKGLAMRCPPGKQRRDSYTQQQTERVIVNKRKIVRMFIVVVVVFAICWFPYHAYFLYTYHNKTVITNPVTRHVYLAFYWLAMANSMINPIIYYLMNARFRFYFRSLMMRLMHQFGQLFVVEASTSFEMDMLPPPPRRRHQDIGDLHAIPAPPPPCQHQHQQHRIHIIASAEEQSEANNLPARLAERPTTTL